MSKHTIFLSHTSRLARFPSNRSYVQAAIDGIVRAGFPLKDMRYFSAHDQTPADVCAASVRECSVYVGLFGLDYGTPVRERPDKISYTELEFLTALEEKQKHGMRVFVFLLDETTAAPELRPFARAQRAFRRRILNDSGLMASPRFHTPEGLELAICQTLT